IRDADLRRNLASQFDLAEQMAQHAYLHVNRERIFSEIPKEDRWRRLDRVYRRWTDASQRDDVFRPGNIEYLVTFWIACVELDYFDELTRAATENRRGLDAADTWFLGALTEVEESFAFPQRLLELRPRDLIAAKERAWNRLATSSL